MSTGRPIEIVPEPERPALRRPSLDLRRVESFSDGVFSIADDPARPQYRSASSRASLGHQLLAVWPAYAAYAVSFLVIAIIWISHHAMFERLDRLDRPFLLGNLLLLMFVAFIPFPTEVMAHGLRSDGTAATAFYGMTMTLVDVTFSALQTYALKARLCPNAGETRGLVVRSWLGPPVYATATVLAFVSPKATLAVYALLTVFFAAPPDLWTRRRR